MDFLTIVTIMLLAMVDASFSLINYFHWRGRVNQRERFFYFPTSGVLGRIQLAFLFGIHVALILSLLDVLPPGFFLGVMLTFAAFGQIYSYWWRQLERRGATPPYIVDSVSTRFTWSPFQSPEVRDICKNLTPQEFRLLFDQSADYFWNADWRSALPFCLAGIAGVSFIYSISVGFAALCVFAIYTLTFDRHRIQANQQRFREMLCSTEYAKARGYRSDALRLWGFPWSRKKTPAS